MNPIHQKLDEINRELKIEYRSLKKAKEGVEKVLHFIDEFPIKFKAKEQKK